LSQLLNMAIGTIAEKLGFDEGSPEKIALHAAACAIVSALSGGNIGSAALAGGAEEWANGILVDVLKANPNLSPISASPFCSGLRRSSGRPSGATKAPR
jgi:filamentous hemagglutinin